MQITSLSGKKLLALLLSLLIIALCGIVYELLIGTISSYLLGNSVYQFSITIGLFMFSMGLGSLITKKLNENYLQNFIFIEILIAFFGGVSGIVLFTVFPYLRIFYELSMYLLIIIIGCLVGMEIPILTSLISKYRNTKNAIAEVMSFDYVGALLGSVIFPLILLPTLGLMHTSFLIGLMNALVAITTLIIFRKDVPRFKPLFYICIITIVMLVTGNLLGGYLTRFAEKNLYFDQIIFSKQSDYQKIVVTSAKKFKDHRLFIDGHIQFSSKDEYRYHEFLVHPIMSLKGKVEDVLVLGGGDGLPIREITKYKNVKLIDVVDIDPVMTDLGKNLYILKQINNNSMQDERVTIYNQDAFIFLNKNGKKYDRVIIDLPDPHNEALSKLYSKEFYTIIKKRLKPDGILVTQSSSPFFSKRTFWCINRTINEVFKTTVPYNISLPSFGIWGFNLASNRNLNTKNLKWDFSVDTRSITPKAMKKALIFEKDLKKIPVSINTIFRPILTQLYNRDLSD
tara:strand:- start:956 stop:2488 length:1533 start_codon:yes stop_codon:yes gene_type:complete